MKAHYRYKTEPMAHQVDSFNMCYGREYFALFAQQGTGKTKMLIDIAVNLYLEGKITAVLVIAPAGVQLQWANEQLPEHCSVEYVSRVFQSGMASKKHEREHREFLSSTGKLKWLLTNVDVFSSDTYLPVFTSFLKKEKTLTAIDEATIIKNISAKRTTNIIYGLADLTKVGRRVVKATPLSVYRVIMTGTPTTNSPFDLYSMFEFLKPGFWGMTMSTFRARYGLLKQETIPGRQPFLRSLTFRELADIRSRASKGVSGELICSQYKISQADFLYITQHSSVVVPYKNLAELQRTIACVAFIKRKQDCLDLPDKIYMTLPVEMTPKQREIYRQALATGTAEFDTGKELNAVNTISLLVRLSQIAGGFFPYAETDEHSAGVQEIDPPNPKIRALIQDMAEAERPLIITTRFVAETYAIRDAVKKAFPDDVVEVIDGSVVKERGDIVERFKRGEVQVLVATGRTISRGYNFQNCFTMYVYSNSYSLEDREQLEDRIHRNGQTEKCLYKDIIAMDSMDQKILEVIRGKRNLLDYVRSGEIRQFFG